MRKILKTLWFNGRINRLEYTISALIIFFSLLAVSARFENPPDWLIVVLVYIYYTQGAKRCQDRGINGFFILNPANFIFNFTEKGDTETNKYGAPENWPEQKILPWFRNIKFYFSCIMEQNNDFCAFYN